MNNASKILLTIGGGIVIGATLGILFAPEEGSETRKKIMKRSKKLAGAVSDTIDGGREALEDVKDVLEKQLYKVNRKIQGVKS